MSKKKEIGLAEAARIMRMSNNPQERKMAAARMGKIGGKHSHDNDPARIKNTLKKIKV